MLALILEDQVRLTRYYPQLNQFRGQFHDALIDRLLGTLEARAGNWPAAQTSLAAAETVARREEFKIELAQTLVAQADLAFAQVKSGQALLDQAIALYQELGNASEVDRLRQRQQRLLPSPSSFPAGLSQREVEVLRLVAAGKSNRQIAQALTLSEKTVANHLTHIFNKTGVDNRAAATAFAMRHNLA
jgi:DNA-binding NarL/FixJ family response regulator